MPDMIEIERLARQMEEDVAILIQASHRAGLSYREIFLIFMKALEGLVMKGDIENWLTQR